MEATEVLRRAAPLGGGRSEAMRGRRGHGRNDDKEDEEAGERAPFRIAERGRKFFCASPEHLRWLDNVAIR